jgi:nucleotide sugar dehydrogenase
MKVGVIGLGTVGQSQVRMIKNATVPLARAAGSVGWIALPPHEVILYDPKLGIAYPAARLERAQMVIICVDTPPAADGAADLTNLEAAYGQLPAGVPVVIRSTVPPGTTDRLAAHSDRLICHVPEFMHERQDGPWPDSELVPYMLLGGTAEALHYFRPLLAQLYAGKIHECSALEAELAKYTANLYWAARVTFVNEMARICAAFGADFEQVRKAWLKDPRMYPAYTRMDGFPPGFGGSCWPKDLSALIAASEDAGYKPGFLEAIREANGRFTS